MWSVVTICTYFLNWRSVGKLQRGGIVTVLLHKDSFGFAEKKAILRRYFLDRIKVELPLGLGYRYKHGIIGVLQIEKLSGHGPDIFRLV